MNKCVLIGRPTKDPELKYTAGSGIAVCTFTIAVNRDFKKQDGKQEADFIPIIVWRKQAENVANYVVKGKLIAVSGRIQTRSYEAKDGTRRYVTEVIADSVQFLEKKGSSGTGTSNNNSSTEATEEDITPIDDGDIPF